MKKQPSNLQAVLVVFTAAAFFFYGFVNMSIFSTIEMKQYFSQSFGMNTDEGAFLFGVVALIFPIGLIIDKVSVKKMILIGLVIMTLAAFGIAHTTNPTVALILRFIMGGAHAIAFMSPFRLAPRWFPANKLAVVSGLIVTFALFGGWVAGIPVQILIASVGAKSTANMVAILGVVITVLAVLFIKDFPKGSEPENVTAENQLSLVEGLKSAGKNAQNWLAGLYIGLLNLAVLILGAMWGSTYLNIMNPDLNPETVQKIVGMIFFGTMIGSPLFGWLSDKMKSRKKTMLLGGVLSTIIMLVIIFPPATSEAVYYALFLLLGIFTASQTVGYPVVAESNDDKVLGTANGLSMVILMGIAAVGQPLFGKLVIMFSGNDTDALQAAFQSAIWVMPIAFIAATLCALFIKETFNKEA